MVPCRPASPPASSTAACMPSPPSMSATRATRRAPPRALTQTVVETRAATTTTLTSGTNPSNQWAPVTFTATVAGAAPTGSVTFYDDATALGTATLNGSAQASLTTSSLAVGWRAITARYAGDATHAPSASTAPLFQTVNPPAGNGKVKVFILAGQSNMVAYGSVENRPQSEQSHRHRLVAGGLGSLRNMLNKNPAKYNYLADPANPVGGNPGWITRSDVWVTYYGDAAGGNRRGILDANFGATWRPGTHRAGVWLRSGGRQPVRRPGADHQICLRRQVAGGGLPAARCGRARGGAVGPYYTDMIAPRPSGARQHRRRVSRLQRPRLRDCRLRLAPGME